MIDLLKFDITGNHSGLSGSFAAVRKELGGVKGALAGVNDYARRTGRTLRNIGAGMTAGITAPLALLGKQSVSLYDQQVRAETAVQQAILSTGGAAGKTLADLKGLAGGLQGLTTFGDEDILQNVTAPLLTFTKVQDEVFDRAQANVLDMATLLKMDLKSASILVGKALNDPVKGISALSRSGVQFSDSQKNVIKSLVETGKVADAQRLILEELETQFQGQAAAAARAPLGQWRQLSNAIGDVKEELGQQIAPFLQPLTDAVKGAVTWFQALSPEVKQTIVIVGGLMAAIGPVLGVVGLLTIGIGALASAFSGLTVAMLTNPFTLILVGVASLAVGIVYATQKVGGLGEMMRLIKDVGLEVWERLGKGADAMGAVMKATASGVKGVFLSAFAWIAEKFTALMQLVASPVNSLLGLVGSDLSLTIGGDIAGSMRSAADEAWDSAEKFRGAASTFAEAATKPLASIEAFKAAWNGVNEEAEDTSSVLSGLTGQVGALGAALAGGAGGGGGGGDGGKGGGAAGKAKKLKSDLDKVKQSAQQLDQTFGSTVSSIIRGADSASSAVAKLLDRLADQVLTSAATSLFSGFGFGKLLAPIIGSARGNAFSGGSIVPFADGGVVSSPTLFPMRGATGLMGEAGPEGILPLTRVGGKLGVHAAGGGRSQVELVVRTEKGVTVEQATSIAGDVSVRVVGAGLRQNTEALRGRLDSYQERGTI